jgi:RND family efflux transporter MFP subunit
VFSPRGTGGISISGCAIALWACATLGTGCTHAPAPPPAAPVVVRFARPIEREILDYADFTGRTAAVDSVELRARVWGYLTKVNFKEGAIVNKGDVLFEIDPLTYNAVLHQAEGNMASLQARVERLDADLARARRMVGTGAMSREDFDKVAGDRGEAIASRDAQKANVERAKLDLGYTKVTAPIAGRISRFYVTVGNLVQAGDQNGGTLLTTIVSVDPMYAYYDVDEYTVLRVRQLVREGKAESPRETVLPVFLGLANEKGFPHEGTINFVDNQLNPRTGTIRLRGTFPNKDQVLLPGYFARIRMPLGRRHKALLVSERALDTDLGAKILYIIDDKNQVVVRKVQLGELHDGLREITSGLNAGERYILDGLQQVRPGVTVEPQEAAGSEVRGQKSEVRSQKTKVRDQKSEVGGQKSEGGSQKSEGKD